MDTVNESNDKRLTALISGRVQGVGFRAFIRRNALDRDLTGYAENLSDGRVEVVAEGDKRDLEDLVVKLRTGPAHAEVEDLEIEWGDGSGLESFYTY